MALKKTLLDIVQEILSDMDSDEVNSISDTTEALQVARVVRSTYEALVTPINVPEHNELAKLESISDVGRPNYLRIPDGVKQLHWFKYNNGTADNPQWVDVEWREPEVFIQLVLNKPAPLTYAPNYNNVELPCGTDAHPRYWTTFDDEYIVCDSYDNSVDDTLQQHKTLAMVETEPVFRLEDTFVPDLDANLFPLLISEAKNACFINFKQVSNANEERKARRQLTRVQSDLHRSKRSRGYPDYSRKGPKG